MAGADYTRFNKIYLPVIVKVADSILEDYGFEDFKEIVLRDESQQNSVVISRRERLQYRKVDVDKLLAPVDN